MKTYRQKGKIFLIFYHLHLVVGRIYCNTVFSAMAEHSVPAVDANLAASSNEGTSGSRPTFTASPQRDFVFEVLSERQGAQLARLADKIETSLSRVSDACGTFCRTLIKGSRR